MYNLIINPDTGYSHNIYSKKGKQILKKMLLKLKGGSFMNTLWGILGYPIITPEQELIELEDEITNPLPELIKFEDEKLKFNIESLEENFSLQEEYNGEDKEGNNIFKKDIYQTDKCIFVPEERRVFSAENSTPIPEDITSIHPDFNKNKVKKGCAVSYLDSLERQTYLLKIDETLLHYTDFNRNMDSEIDIRTQLIYTSLRNTEKNTLSELPNYEIETTYLSSKNGINKLSNNSIFNLKSSREGFIFVYDTEENLYVTEYHDVGKFHHSSFLSGNDVKCAGKINFENGVILSISNDSGHYKPDFKCLLYLLENYFEVLEEDSLYEFIKFDIAKIKVKRPDLLREKEMATDYNKWIEGKMKLKIKTKSPELYNSMPRIIIDVAQKLNEPDIKKIRDDILKALIYFPPPETLSFSEIIKKKIHLRKIEVLVGRSKTFISYPGFWEIGPEIHKLNDNKYLVYIPKKLIGNIVDEIMEGNTTGLLKIKNYIILYIRYFYTL